MRIGVVGCTHELGDGTGQPIEVLQILSTVDLILYCGDLETLGILNHLETIAPVKAVRGYGDPHESGERLAEQTRVIKIDDIRIGMIHDINWPGPSVVFSDTLEFNKVSSIDLLLEKKFGETVDVVCFSDTHEEYIGWYQGKLFVNPGSTAHPGIRHKKYDLGTLAILDIRNNVVSAEIVYLKYINQYKKV